jgi:hypothetical protein
MREYLVMNKKGEIEEIAYRGLDAKEALIVFLDSVDKESVFGKTALLVQREIEQEGE